MDKEGWLCRHTTPSAMFTDLRAWLEYQVELEDEVRRRLPEWQARKQAKLDDGKAALVETTEIAKLENQLRNIQASLRLGILMEALADMSASGKLELTRPRLRFAWSNQTR